jgi:hypothetical protein
MAHMKRLFGLLELLIVWIAPCYGKDGPGSIRTASSSQQLAQTLAHGILQHTAKVRFLALERLLRAELSLGSVTKPALSQKSDSMQSALDTATFRVYFDELCCHSSALRFSVRCLMIQERSAGIFCVWIFSPCTDLTGHRRRVWVGHTFRHNNRSTACANSILIISFHHTL